MKERSFRADQRIGEFAVLSSPVCLLLAVPLELAGLIPFFAYAGQLMVLLSALFGLLALTVGPALWIRVAGALEFATVVGVKLLIAVLVLRYGMG